MIKEDVNMKVLDIRNYFDLSKEGLSKILEVTSREVAEWEQDQNKLTKEDMAKFHKIFNITEECLLSSKNSPLLCAKIKYNCDFEIIEFRDEYYKGYSIFDVKKRKKIPLILWPFIVLFWFIIVIIVFAAAFADLYFYSSYNDAVYLLENDKNIIIIETKKEYVYITPIKQKIDDKKFEHYGHVFTKLKKIG